MVLRREVNEQIILVGITGVIGSGKTTVAKIIEELGGKVLYSDDIAKSQMENNDSLRIKIISTFGEKSYKSDGRLDREYMASLVFGDSEKSINSLSKLDEIVHPFVIDYLINEIEKHSQQCENLIFIESALIYEAGLEEGFDYIITVYAEDEKRIERYISQTNISPEQIKKRMQHQIPQNEKKELADFVIENNDTIGDLKRSTEIVYNIIKSLEQLIVG